MSSRVVDWTLEAAAARESLRTNGGLFAPGAVAEITNTSEFGTWLDTAATSIRESNLIPELKPGSNPDTLYLWLNDAVFNPGGCFAAAQAADHSQEDPSFPPPWSNRIGRMLGDVRGGVFYFSGLEPVLELFAEHVVEDPPPGAGAGSALIYALICAAVDDVLAERLDFGCRVALSRSEAARVVTWDLTGGTWVSAVHTS